MRRNRPEVWKYFQRPEQSTKPSWIRRELPFNRLLVLWMLDLSIENCLFVECQSAPSWTFSQIGRFELWKKWLFLETEDFCDTINLFFDFDQSILVKLACARVTLNFSCCVRLFKFRIGAMKSPGGEQMKTFEKHETVWSLLKIKM